MRGVLPSQLVSPSISPELPQAHRACSFDLTTSERTYTFYCKSERDLYRWLDMLRLLPSV